MHKLLHSRAWRSFEAVIVAMGLLGAGRSARTVPPEHHKFRHNLPLFSFSYWEDFELLGAYTLMPHSASVSILVVRDVAPER